MRILIFLVCRVEDQTVPYFLELLDGLWYLFCKILER